MEIIKTKTMRNKIRNITLSLMLLGSRIVMSQDFGEVKNKINTFVASALSIINIVGVVFCLIFIIRIAMAYWGGGEEGRQDAGGMIKKLLIGVIVWLVMYQVVNGIFGTNFGQQ